MRSICLSEPPYLIMSVISDHCVWARPYRYIILAFRTEFSFRMELFPRREFGLCAVLDTRMKYSLKSRCTRFEERFISNTTTKLDNIGFYTGIAKCSPHGYGGRPYLFSILRTGRLR